MANQQHREIVRDAMKVSELWYQLSEVIAIDDDCEVDDYTDWDIVSEAMFVQNKYLDQSDCWIHREALEGKHGEEDRKGARRELRQLNRFLKKWKPTVENPRKSGARCPVEKSQLSGT